MDDSYCKLYEKVIQNKGDGASIAKIDNLAVKKRILGNEQLQRGTCPAP